MNPSETAFLVLGLVLGIAVGAALWQAIRSRPAPRREVRLTIAPNSIPARRASTLATPGGSRDAGPLPGSPDGDAFTGHPVTPAPGLKAGSPATALTAAAPAATGAQMRTSVPSRVGGIPANAVAVPIVSDGRALVAASTPELIGVATPASGAGPAGRGPGSGGAFVLPASPRVTAAARARASVVSASLARSALAVSSLEAPQGRGRGSAGNGTGAGDPASAGPGGTRATPRDPADAGTCAEDRRVVDERCGLADAARSEARRAADALRTAQRAYDALRERVERAQEVADPRRIADTKARLHGAFRAASDTAAGPDQAEAAAREWLEAINRLNAAVREAARLTEVGGAEMRAQLPALERLGLEAEAARIGAENAAESCQAAREQLAACEERASRAALAAAAAVEPEEEHPLARAWPAEEPALAVAAAGPAGTGTSAIILVLRGDRDARERIVAALAGSDGDARREWHLRIAQLVDAITARAIEDGYLDLPTDDPFWHMFSPREARDVVGALSALGFRYDGMGGLADERVPTPRDLSLAVGYAGLDPMRIRTWPREDALARLYAKASVAADEWLLAEAGDLSLGRMVDALGARAAALADTWNAWGRMRPVLLAE